MVKFPPASCTTTRARRSSWRPTWRIGVYFNEAMAHPEIARGYLFPRRALPRVRRKPVGDVRQPAQATIYATGAVDLRTSGDIKTGPALHMKFGFGAEIVVRAAGRRDRHSSVHGRRGDHSDDTELITVAAFLLFRGRAEILGGIVTVTHHDRGEGNREAAAPETAPT